MNNDATQSPGFSHGEVQRDKMINPEHYSKSKATTQSQKLPD